MDMTMKPSPHPLPPAAEAPGDAALIGMLLLDAGKISPDGAAHALRMQRELGMRFGEAAMRLGLVTEADIEQVLARQFAYPYLRPDESALSPQLLAAFAPFSAQAETLRAVRSQLMLRWFAHGRRALAVAAVEAGDGASLLAANLAIVFAQLGERTLLVDADLRAPRQHELFALKGRQGLSDLLAGRAGNELIARVPSFPALSVLQAGTLPPNPQELLSRDALRQLNRSFERHYDVVLYDVAPFAGGVDALAVAARTGGVLLLARKHHTRLDQLSRMAAQLADAGAEVVGSVMVEF